MLGFVLFCPNLYPWSFGKLKPYVPVQWKVPPHIIPDWKVLEWTAVGCLSLRKDPVSELQVVPTEHIPTFPQWTMQTLTKIAAQQGMAGAGRRFGADLNPFTMTALSMRLQRAKELKYSMGLCHDKAQESMSFLCCFFTSENTAANIFFVQMYRMYKTKIHSPQLPYSRLWSPYPWMWGHYGGCLSKKTSLTQTGKGETTSASLRQSQKLKERTDIPVASVFNLSVWFLKKAKFGESLYG